MSLSESWEHDVRDAFAWSGAAVGSTGAVALYALTAWYMALALCLIYVALFVRFYRRAFVLPLVDSEPRGVVMTERPSMTATREERDA